MRHLYLAGFLAFSPLLAGSALLAETDSPYRITEVEGRVAVVPQGSSDGSPATVDFSLEPGDQILTGENARVEIATHEGTVMELSGQSSMTLEESSPSVSTFFLKVGRLLARFASAKETGREHRLRTPVAVAAVRGTELALEVGESGNLDAGVVEGEVALLPSNDGPAADGQMADWQNVVLQTSQGARVAPRTPPVRLSEIPPVLVPSVGRFAHIRQRVPHLRERWKHLDPPTRKRLRQEALRERIKWQPPARLQRKERNEWKDRNERPGPSHMKKQPSRQKQ